MRPALVAAALSLVACASAPSGEAALELRTSATSVDVIKGTLTLSAVATDEAGRIGTGRVTFTSELGELSADAVTLDEFGKGEVTFTCLDGVHPGCESRPNVELTATWARSPVKVTATRRLPLRRPVMPSTDGGAGAFCQQQGDCQMGLACFDGTCVGSGQLRFSLSWMAQSDFDLHVLTPSGKHLFFGNRRDDGGELDVDACVRQSFCRATNVENIFWSGAPPTGTYTVYVVNFNGVASGDFRIQVAGGSGAPQQFTGTLPATRMAESMRFTIAR